MWLRSCLQTFVLPFHVQLDINVLATVCHKPVCYLKTDSGWSVSPCVNSYLWQVSVHVQVHRSKPLACGLIPAQSVNLTYILSFLHLYIPQLFSPTTFSSPVVSNATDALCIKPFCPPPIRSDHSNLFLPWLTMTFKSCTLISELLRENGINPRTSVKNSPGRNYVSWCNLSWTILCWAWTRPYTDCSPLPLCRRLHQLVWSAYFILSSG